MVDVHVLCMLAADLWKETWKDIRHRLLKITYGTDFLR